MLVSPNPLAGFEGPLGHFAARGEERVGKRKGRKGTGENIPTGNKFLHAALTVQVS